MSVNNRLGYLTITYTVPFINNKYYATAQGGYIKDMSAMAYNINELTTTTMQIQGVAVDNSSASGTPETICWRTEGYIR